jgi:hypothetical protein
VISIHSVVDVLVGFSGLSNPSIRRRLLCIFLVSVSLFPCICFTDDLVQLRTLASNVTPKDDIVRTAQGQKLSASDSLLDRILNELEHLQLSSLYTLIFPLGFASFFALALFPADIGSYSQHSGRSPPPCLKLAAI